MYDPNRPSIFKNLGTILRSTKDIVTVGTTRVADVMEHQANKLQDKAKEAKVQREQELNQ